MIEDKPETRTSHRLVLLPVYVVHTTMPIVVGFGTGVHEPNYGLLGVVVAGSVFALRLSSGTTEQSDVLLALGAQLAFGLCAASSLLQGLRIARLQPILKVLEGLGLRAGLFAVCTLAVTVYARQLSGSMLA